MSKNKDDHLVLEVIGVRVNLVQISDVIVNISQWIDSGKEGNYVVLTNANDAVAARQDERIRNATNNSSLTVADGISLVLVSWLSGHPIKKRVYGPDLMLEFLRFAELKGYSNFFYGTTPETLKHLIENLKRKFPKLIVAGSFSPPFNALTTQEDQDIVKTINKAAPDVVWVGLGTPKQQLWMYEHRGKLRVPVMIGVGAAFDFLSGLKPQAPRWIRDNGFEWLFRLATEPKRLWRRYLINNLLFIYYLGLEAVSRGIKSLLNK